MLNRDRCSTHHGNSDTADATSSFHCSSFEKVVEKRFEDVVCLSRFSRY